MAIKVGVVVRGLVVVGVDKRGGGIGFGDVVEITVGVTVTLATGTTVAFGSSGAHLAVNRISRMISCSWQSVFLSDIELPLIFIN